MATLNEHTRATWDGLLRSVGEAPKATDLSLTLCHSSRGSAYAGELMVVGRALNGWGVAPPYTAADLRDAELRSSVVAAEADRLAAMSCQMAWVERYWGRKYDYSTASSAFWRVAKRVTESLGVAQGDGWASHLVWSNLYRVSPREKGNPPAWLQTAQASGCRELLRADAGALQPRRVLFLTGPGWLDSVDPDLRAGLEPVGENNVIAAGDWRGARIVVADHPQGRKERPMVAEIVRGFARGAA